MYYRIQEEATTSSMKNSISFCGVFCKITLTVLLHDAGAYTSFLIIILIYEGWGQRTTYASKWLASGRVLMFFSYVIWRSSARGHHACNILNTCEASSLDNGLSFSLPVVVWVLRQVCVTYIWNFDGANENLLMIENSSLWPLPW